MKKKEISEIEAMELAVKIIRLLDGLSIGQANWALSETKQLLYSTQLVDVSGHAFTEALQELEAFSDQSA